MAHVPALDDRDFKSAVLLNFIYLFREKGKEGEREGEKHLHERETSTLHTHPNQGLNLQPRHVP